MNKEQAALIVEAHEIDKIVGSTEEKELLQEHNPRLLQAYEALIALSEMD